MESKHSPWDYTRVDMEDIVLRDARIMELERHNKELLELLHGATEALTWYSNQHNGYIAQTIITRMQGGH